ncbi:hypothetical protein J6590_067305 [Homalodisca vitripennis]|nr:hypothetical protein J6590_067305 [Homalodisca vitripennis]
MNGGEPCSASERPEVRLSQPWQNVSCVKRGVWRHSEHHGTVCAIPADRRDVGSKCAPINTADLIRGYNQKLDSCSWSLPSTLNDHSSPPVYSQLSLQNRSDKQSELLLVLPSTLNDHSSSPVHSQLSLQNRSDKQSELLLVLPSTLNDHSSPPVYSQLSLQNRSDKQSELLLVLPSTLNDHSSSPVHSQLSLQNRSDQQTVALGLYLQHSMTTPLPLCILSSACRTDLINRQLLLVFTFNTQ